jgi:ABC-type molybdate transport system substrate-binding protein
MRHLLAAAVLAMIASSASAQEPIRLYAAGSLKAAMLDIADAFAKQTGTKVVGTFGASGLLRERIEKGEPAEVFASADLGHPTTLNHGGKAGPVVVFTRNRLCALARADLNVTPLTLLDRMLDPQVKLGTSTPKADPSGDYAWALFEKAEKLGAGSFATLEAKALKLVGGPNSPAPPADRSLYGVMMENKQADIFLSYCTNAAQAAKEVPSLRVVAIPEALEVGADYGLTVLKGARAEAAQFAFFILSRDGQTILANHGFTPVALPAQP